MGQVLIECGGQCFFCIFVLERKKHTGKKPVCQNRLNKRAGGIVRTEQDFVEVIAQKRILKKALKAI